MKYYLKQLILPFVYLVCLGFSGYAIALLGANWAEILVSSIMLFFFSYLMTLLFYREGQAALKTRNANDIEREYMVKTGKDANLNLTEEYKWYKPFIFGLLVSAPLIICAIIHLILMLAVGPEANGAAEVGSRIYMLYYQFLRYIFGPLVGWDFFWVLTFIPYICLLFFVSYYLGSVKVKRQTEEIKAKHRMLHGDEN